MAAFYFNKSDKRVETKNLQEVTTAGLTFIDRTDILNPIIKLSKEIDPHSFNYLYIPEFNRYYWVSEPPTFDAGFYTVKLHVDVLMSWDSHIRGQQAIIKRNEKKFNMYLDDPQFKVQNRTSLLTLEFPSGFNTTKHIVMGVVGKNNNGGGK